MADAPRFNTALKLAIIHAGITQRTLAFRAEISEGTVSSIIRGHLDATPDHRRKLAKALRKPVAELFVDDQQEAVS